MNGSGALLPVWKLHVISIVATHGPSESIAKSRRQRFKKWKTSSWRKYDAPTQLSFRRVHLFIDSQRCAIDQDELHELSHTHTHAYANAFILDTPPVCLTCSIPRSVTLFHESNISRCSTAVFETSTQNARPLLLLLYDNPPFKIQGRFINV